MTNKSRDNVRRELEIIRKLMDEDNLTDAQIIRQLQINERTFFRYKKKLRNNYVKAWEKMDKDNAAYNYAKFIDSLEYCYYVNKKIVDDPHSSAHDKTEASKVMCFARQQISKLDKKGPIFQPQLLPTQPNKVIPIDSKEITV